MGVIDVQLGRYLKYPGLTLDSHWDFRELFIRSVSGYRGCLLPSLEDSGKALASMQVSVVRPMALYGSPV